MMIRKKEILSGLKCQAYINLAPVLARTPDLKDGQKGQKTGKTSKL